MCLTQVGWFVRRFTRQPISCSACCYGSINEHFKTPMFIIQQHTLWKKAMVLSLLFLYFLMPVLRTPSLFRVLTFVLHLLIHRMCTFTFCLYFCGQNYSQSDVILVSGHWHKHAQAVNTNECQQLLNLSRERNFVNSGKLGNTEKWMRFSAWTTQCLELSASALSDSNGVV